jgi:uncharacterized protein YkwD
MRRALMTGALVAVLASGCGGGSDRTGGQPAGSSRSQAPATTVTPAATVGRLGGAVIARPGKTTLLGGVEKITGRSILPPSIKHAVGAEENCPDINVQPTPDNLAHVSDVIFCLMNAMRTNAGLPLLGQQDQLAKASVDHSQDMVDHKYFAHDTQDGRDVVARLTQAGYIPKTGDWVVGENLAWGSGSLATPQSLVNAWMNSPPHRENLLAGDYVDVGMGVVYGTPSSNAPDGITVTTDFGVRPNLTASSSRAAVLSARRSSAAKRRARTAARRRHALRRCSHRHGTAKRRCVRAARRIR